MMRLAYFPINCAYGFVFGETPISLAENPFLYTRKQDAIDAAARLGLFVDPRNGFTSVM